MCVSACVCWGKGEHTHTHTHRQTDISLYMWSKNKSVPHQGALHWEQSEVLTLLGGTSRVRSLCYQTVATASHFKLYKRKISSFPMNSERGLGHRRSSAKIEIKSRISSRRELPESGIFRARKKVKGFCDEMLQNGHFRRPPGVTIGTYSE